MNNAATTANPDALRQEWLSLLDGLIADVSAWAAEQGWLVNKTEKLVTERALGTYATAELLIKTPQGHVVLDPIAQSISGGDGRVDLYAWPSLNRVMLIRRGDRWVVRTDSGVTWPHPWGRDSFVELVKELSMAA